jgi:nucleotide-binding universal stress UspA family protein
MKPRFERILVPVDFSEKNEAALDVAAELARANQARATLLHVVETINVEADEEMDRFYARLQSQADAELDRLARRIESTGVPLDRVVRIGKRLQEIVSFSVDEKIDLIVLSSQKLDVHKPTQSWATLSYQISVVCSCPVMLVK